MNDLAKLYMQRAENELVAANILFRISSDEKLQNLRLKPSNYLNVCNS